MGRKRTIAKRIWVERKEWADRKEEAALDAMKKEGPTKAAKRTKARKEKAGAAASRKLACLCLKEENGDFVKDGEAAAGLIGNFFKGLYGSPNKETYGEAEPDGGGREEWNEWSSIFATEQIMDGI